MYDYINGSLQTICLDYVVLDAGGIGYKICVPRVEQCRSLSSGSPLKLYVDLIIREDAHTLYGFSCPKDRDFFRLLLQVNGIGPKVAINIMSGTCAANLASALHSRDVKFLSTIPGIGKKLAERLVVELREKISSLCETGSADNTLASALSLDTCRALETLGLSMNEARKLVAQVQSRHPQTTTVEGMLQHALTIKRESKYE
jgi:holliday junction DNA helicase RuvA